MEEGKKNALFSTLAVSMMSGDMGDFLEFTSKKKDKKTSTEEFLKEIKRESVLKSLQGIRDTMYKTPLEVSKIGEPTNDFLTYCKDTVNSSTNCPGYRSKLEEAQKELFRALDERKTSNQEFKSGLSYVVDVPIAILSMMSDSEFELVKNLGLEFVKDQLD